MGHWRGGGNTFSFSDDNVVYPTIKTIVIWRFLARNHPAFLVYLEPYAKTVV